ncbi:hemerythrin domain-containing protein [Aspergillus undulatus]|uniref:hemerythrin domain-containing protein n=1 Tax=Aspergillus undulatus TaxID=1810928 RepID=UPI003CCCB8BF
MKAKAKAKPERKLKLESLSPADFAIYNRFAEQMGLMHDKFRYVWTEMKDACSSSSTSSSNTEYMTDEEIILLGRSFVSNLSMHHDIEERFLFPHLAERMIEFAPDGVLIGQHEAIHEGIGRLEGYLRDCERAILGEGERLDRRVLRGIMMGEGGKFERVLWEHLDKEVELLKAENLSLFFSVDEIRRFPL